MARRYRRKCRHCKAFFVPDRRNAKRQHYCSEDACRAASKAASQKRWLSKLQNQGYFSGPEQVARVQEWRHAHPNYWRKTCDPAEHPESVLQDLLITQAIDIKDKIGQFMALLRFREVNLVGCIEHRLIIWH